MMFHSQLPDEFNVEVGIPTDQDGYLDRECPNERCNTDFKILLDDWNDKVRDEEVFCPVCGHTATSDEWFTQAQLEHMKSKLMAEFQPILDADMKRMTRDINRGMPRGGLISISMSYKPSRPVTVVPVEVAELMQQRYTCESCGCRYAAVGVAFFCPSCGHNSARTALMDSLSTIRRLPEIRAILESGLDRDAAANAYRLMLEENVSKLVSVFQRFAEATFETLPNTDNFNPRRNVFQNLSESSDLWEQAIGVRYESMLSHNDWKELKHYFQQRHLLVHNDGIVDKDYLKKTESMEYQCGQRLVIKESDIIRFSALVEKLTTALQTACADTVESERTNDHRG